VFKFSARIRRGWAALGLALISVDAACAGAAASRAMVPTIWVDPDGCEHWVMDGRGEGYLTPNVTRQGISRVPSGSETCAVMNFGPVVCNGRADAI